MVVFQLLLLIAEYNVEGVLLWVGVDVVFFEGGGEDFLARVGHADAEGFEDLVVAGGGWGGSGVGPGFGGGDLARRIPVATRHAAWSRGWAGTIALRADEGGCCGVDAMRQRFFVVTVAVRARGRGSGNIAVRSFGGLRRCGNMGVGGSGRGKIGAGGRGGGLHVVAVHGGGEVGRSG